MIKFIGFLLFLLFIQVPSVGSSELGLGPEEEDCSELEGEEKEECLKAHAWLDGLVEEYCPEFKDVVAAPDSQPCYGLAAAQRVVRELRMCRGEAAVKGSTFSQVMYTAIAARDGAIAASYDQFEKCTDPTAVADVDDMYKYLCSRTVTTLKCYKCANASAPSPTTRQSSPTDGKYSYDDPNNENYTEAIWCPCCKNTMAHITYVRGCLRKVTEQCGSQDGGQDSQ